MFIADHAYDRSIESIDTSVSYSCAGQPRQAPCQVSRATILSSLASPKPSTTAYFFPFARRARDKDKLVSTHVNFTKSAMGCIGMSLEAIVHDASADIVASCPICDETQAILHPIKQVFRSRLEHTLPSRPKATLLTLDLEVQTKLLSYIAPRDALRLSMTCRTAFKAALPRALSDIQVGMPRREGGVLTEKQFALFCEWVITDDTRPSLLTGFTIRRPAPLTQDLVDLLRRCKKLRRLWLEGSEAAFAHVPGLADAIIHLEDLDFVFFDSSGAHACSVLARMQSQPRTVRLINWDPTSNPSAGKLLSRPHVLCINTVVHLDLTDLSILRALAQDMVWPCVETLRVNRLTDVATTAAAFPNLRVLHVAEPCQATGVVSVRSLHNWAQLDSASVQSPLPLSRPVRRLHIGMITAEWVAEARGCDVPRMLARMLDETIPVVLGCTLGRWAKGRVLGEVARLPAVTKYLKYLQLSVVFDGDIERNRAGEEVEEWLVRRIYMNVRRSADKSM